MKCGTYMFLIGLKHPLPSPQNVYGDFVPDLDPQFCRDPNDILTRVSLVAPECSVKCGPNCSRFHEMAAILNRKNHIFALFYESVLVILTKHGRDIVRCTSHLVR